MNTYNEDFNSALKRLIDGLGKREEAPRLTPELMERMADIATDTVMEELRRLDPLVGVTRQEMALIAKALRDYHLAGNEEPEDFRLSAGLALKVARSVSVRKEQEKAEKAETKKEEK